MQSALRNERAVENDVRIASGPATWSGRASQLGVELKGLTTRSDLLDSLRELAEGRWMTRNCGSNTYLPILVACVGLLGCGGEDAGTTPPVESPEVSFETSSYSLMPGEEKRYFCYTTRLPEDQETIITEITPTYGAATHHLGIYYTLSPEPDGAFECPELVRETWLPLYGGGVESGSLKLPEGAGFRLPKNTQVLVQLHLLNASSAAIEDKAAITFKTADPAREVTPAGMFGFDNRTIQIPAASKDFEQAMSCPAVGREMNVFAVFGHMHTLGKHIEASRGASPGDEILYEADWLFDDQPTIPANFQIKPTDNIHIRCWYDNPTTHTLTYGENTSDEMCSFVFYYTPYEALDGCVSVPP
jgi:hypothetical protein